MHQCLVLTDNRFSRMLVDICKLYNHSIAYSNTEEDCFSVFAFLNLSGTDSNLEESIPILSIEDAKELVSEGSLNTFLIAYENYRFQVDYLGIAWSLGFRLEQIFFSSEICSEHIQTEHLSHFFVPYFQFPVFPYFEFHLADHCNLNCFACEHYSGLVEKEVFPDFSRFEQDFRKLRTFITDIGTIRLLGGEPLLNPEINRYLRLSRELYPRAQIWVVTNGLLLRKMPDSFYTCLKEISGMIWISFYPPMEKQMADLKQFLDEKEISYEVSDLMTDFRVCQQLEPNDDFSTQEKFISCYQKSCHNLYEGKIAACFLPFTTKYFNNYFGESLPEDGAIDLYEEGLNLEKILRRLATPFERCRYCGYAEEYPWRQIQHPSQLDDWIRKI